MGLERESPLGVSLAVFDGGVDIVARLLFVAGHGDGLEAKRSGREIFPTGGVVAALSKKQF